MRRRLGPRSMQDAVSGLMTGVRPSTPLARVQAAWPGAVGPAVAPHATPVALHGAVLEVACDSAVWAQEVELLQGQFVAGLEGRLGAGVVTSVRARAAYPEGAGDRRRGRLHIKLKKARFAGVSPDTRGLITRLGVL